MRTLTQIASLFSELDRIPEERVSQLDKGLRNLTQRTFIHPDAQEGRAFLYGDNGVALIRLVDLAGRCGLQRPHVEGLKNWLSNSGTRRQPVKGGYRGVPRIEEALARTQAGENFAFNVVINAEGIVSFSSTWKVDEEPSVRVSSALDLAFSDSPQEIGRFVLPASKHLRQLLKALKA